MKRRNFIHHSAIASIAGAFPGLYIPKLLAQEATPFNGTLLLTLFAGGGWDQSSWADPRNDPSINRWARGGNNAKSIGRFKYAPWAENEEFFRKYYRDMLVFNGIDLQNGGHAGADRNAATGKLSNYPSANVLYAAIKGDGLPIPLLTQRVADFTQSIQPATALPDAAGMKRLTSSNIRDSRNSYYRQSDVEIINRYRVERLERMGRDQKLLPFTERKMNELLRANTDRGLLGRLADAIPDSFDNADLKGQYQGGNMIQHMHKILVAMSAGVTVTSDIRTQHNYDSHRSHDANHSLGLTSLARIVDYTWEKAKDLGIDNRLCLVVRSDVGRTPRYNGNAGKDHWQNGSMMIMKKNQNWTNRVVGVSGPKHEKININPTTLQPVTTGGVRLKTEHFQMAIREILGIQNDPLCQKYALDDVPAIDIFNPRNSSPVRV